METCTEYLVLGGERASDESSGHWTGRSGSIEHPEALTGVSDELRRRKRRTGGYGRGRATRVDAIFSVAPRISSRAAVASLFNLGSR